jgi:hypothetical protein
MLNLQKLVNMTYTEILSGAPNREGGGQTTYKLIKKISLAQSLQPDLNLKPYKATGTVSNTELPRKVLLYHDQPGAGLTW